MNEIPRNNSIMNIPAGQSHDVGYHGYAPNYGGYNDASHQEENDAFNPLVLLFYLLKYRIMIILFLIAGTFLGLFVYLLQAPIYRATALVEISPNGGARVLEDLQALTTNNDNRAFETARLKFESLELSKRVVFELNLQSDEAFLASVPRFSLKNLLDRAFGINREDDIGELSSEQRNLLAHNKVKGSTDASLVRNTSVISVSYSHTSPEKAQQVASQIAKSYVDLNVDKKIETSSVARDFIREQVIEAKAKLEASEKALVDYAREQSITITGESGSITATKISDINRSLSETIDNRLTIERLVRQIEDGQSDSLPAVFESESIQNKRQIVTELNAEYSQKLTTLKPGFPEMVQLRRQITSIEGQISKEINAIARSVQIQFEQLKEKELALAEELKKLEKEDSDFQEKNIQYTILKREADSDRAQYESLFTKLNEVGIGAELRVANANIVELPQLPKSPESPRLFFNLALGLLLSSGACAGAIVLREMLNSNFVGPDQVEEHLKLPVLGIIPKAEPENLAQELMDPKSGISEAYRSLRTSLQFSGADLNMKTLAVTSSEPSEAKSTTALQLAREFAKLDRNVLIIDADLRKPNLHRLFKMDNNIGLSNLLSNVVPKGVISSVFRKVEEENLTFLPAGTIPPNPADLLVSQRMGLILHACSKNFDLIILDCPPVIGLSDAPIITRQVESTLFVVAANATSRKSAESALNRIKNTGANIVGAALTRFDNTRLENSYSYRYLNYNYYNYSDATDSNKLLENSSHGDARNDASNSALGSARNFFNNLQRRIG